jgi:hypothetical protein
MNMKTFPVHGWEKFSRVEVELIEMWYSEFGGL